MKSKKLYFFLLLVFLVFTLVLASLAYSRYTHWLELKNKIDAYQQLSDFEEKEQMLQEEIPSVFLEAKDFSLEALTKTEVQEASFVPSVSQHNLSVWKKRVLRYELLTLKEQQEALKRQSLAYKMLQVLERSEVQSFFEKENLIFPETERLEKPLTSLRVYLDEGHGGKDPGAISPKEDKSNPKFPEKTSNLLVASVFKQQLEHLGAEVEALRQEERFISLPYRAALVAEASLKDFLKTLQEEIQYRRSFDAVLLKANDLTQAENQEQIAYFQEILTVLEKETIPFYQEQFDKIYEENLDTTDSLFSGYGASIEARLLYDIEASLMPRLFISIHANASLDTSTKGTQAYFLSNTGIFGLLDAALPEGYTYQTSFSQKNEKEDKAFYPQYLNFQGIERALLAKNLYRSVSEHLPELKSDEGLQSLERYFFVLRTVAYPSVLYETAFISNPEDFLLLQNEKKREVLAEALVKGILDYYSALES